MESLALFAAIILFTSLVGGPVAILLTFLPDKPKSVRVFRTIAVVLLALMGIFFGSQLALVSSIPPFPRLIGIFGLVTSIAALLYEFKVLKHKQIGESERSDSKIYAVIFKSKRQDANSELYYQHNDLLDEKIKSLPGYIKHSGLRHPETREGVTIAYFNSLDAIDNWRKDGEHMDAKKLAKSEFYENYSVEVTEVLDAYGWDGN
ncbi:MAG: antibiotic biosynthesis monooxygenase [Candidatus Nanopelagicaceae bacterium]|nr:antibiotic biosynthesis monooxygenase [Candidatus Nanopelagicaceae bacterium]